MFFSVFFVNENGGLFNFIKALAFAASIKFSPSLNRPRLPAVITASDTGGGEGRGWMREVMVVSETVEVGCGSNKRGLRLYLWGN